MIPCRSKRRRKANRYGFWSDFVLLGWEGAVWKEYGLLDAVRNVFAVRREELIIPELTSCLELEDCEITGMHAHSVTTSCPVDGIETCSSIARSRFIPDSGSEDFEIGSRSGSKSKILSGQRVDSSQRSL